MRTLLLASLFLLALGCTPAEEPTPTPDPEPAADAPLTVEAAWARPAGEGANTALYATLVGGSEADTLLSAMSDAAATVEVHESFEQDGMMSMRPAGPIPIPAGETVELRPGGYHVMLIGATRALTEGDRVPAILSFAHAGGVSVLAPVSLTPPSDAAMTDTMGVSPPAE